jgi:hypothetical protein
VIPPLGQPIRRSAAHSRQGLGQLGHIADLHEVFPTWSSLPRLPYLARSLGARPPPVTARSAPAVSGICQFLRRRLAPSHKPPGSPGSLLAYVLQEYARQAGHLDIGRELIDGTTGE